MKEGKIMKKVFRRQNEKQKGKIMKKVLATVSIFILAAVAIGCIAAVAVSEPPQGEQKFSSRTLEFGGHT